ncbi:MAG: hypothetical protein DWI26_03945 [Planctomycetota bacterium]|nr:MAG: hypothetical protein DWI26_03945 [Planctomycetota bacterium]
MNSKPFVRDPRKRRVFLSIRPTSAQPRSNQLSNRNRSTHRLETRPLSDHNTIPTTPQTYQNIRDPRGYHQPSYGVGLST